MDPLRLAFRTVFSEPRQNLARTGKKEGNLDYSHDCEYNVLNIIKIPRDGNILLCTLWIPDITMNFDTTTVELGDKELFGQPTIVPYPYEVNWQLVTENGSLTPICYLSLSLAVIQFFWQVNWHRQRT